MSKKIVSIVLSLALVLSSFLVIFSSPKVTQAASGLDRSGRWLTYNGGHPYIVGFDTQQLVADSTMDYTAALNSFQAKGINKLRLWLVCPWNKTYLYPWTMSGGKVNLDSWNATYWSRLDSFVAAAQSRGIVVEISLFTANYIDSSTDFSSYSVWNKANNVNNAFTANANGTFDPDFFNMNLTQTSSSGKTLLQYQEALVDKAVAEVGGYDNVYFEVCNEIPGSGIAMSAAAPWQNFIGARVNSATSRLVGTHAHEWAGAQTNGIQYFWDQTYNDLLTFHFTVYDPAQISSLLHSAQTHGKVLQTNEGSTVGDYTNEDLIGKGAWAFFMAGGYYSAYVDDTHTIGGTDWNNIADRLKVLRDIAESVTFWTMSPVDASGNEYDSLVSQGPSGSNHQVLADPGNQYVDYFWGSASTTSVIMNLPAGTYDYKFYDVRDESIVGQGSVTSAGGNTTITSPATSGWTAAAGLALTIKKQVSSALISNLVVNDTANAADWSIQSNIQNGNNLYGDRTYAVASLPSGFAGSDWIRPANDSKAYTGTTLVTFKVNANSNVYVAHSNQSSPLPSWLSGWTNTGTSLTTNQPDTYTVYSKYYAAGSTVSLGNDADINHNTYAIIVKPASGGTTTLYSIADTYGQDGTYANTNFGTATALEVKSQSVGANRHGFVKFNVSGISSVSNAKLRVYNVFAQAATTVDAYSVTDDSWTETGLTWNNMPSLVSLLDSQSVSAAGTWYEYDVTSFVNSQLADGTVSIGFQYPTSSSVCTNFATRESANVPQLVITP